MGGKKEDEDGCGEGGIRKSSPVTENERRVRSLGKEVSIHNSGSTCHLDSYLKGNCIHCAYAIALCSIPNCEYFHLRHHGPMLR